jgi:hypothetical protein
MTADPPRSLSIGEICVHIDESTLRNCGVGPHATELPCTQKQLSALLDFGIVEKCDGRIRLTEAGKFAAFGQRMGIPSE